MPSHGTYSPSRNEIMAIRNALFGWRDVGGLGPDYFSEPEVDVALFSFITTGKKVPGSVRLMLSKGRARMVNFFELINPTLPAVAPATAQKYLPEVSLFLKQLSEQAEIWRNGSFKNLDMSRSEQDLFFRVMAHTAPVLFNMGFADAIPHSGQVSRLTASMASNLGGRHSEVLQAAIVGWLHDPKFHPNIDVGKQNLATHPINAAGLAWCVFQDDAIMEMLAAYVNGNTERAKGFVMGAVDALGINNDSRFVQMMVVLPTYTRLVSELYGPSLAEQFKSVIEARLESAAKGVLPRRLPAHLHGALSQIRLDSGLRGVSKHGLARAITEAGIQAGDPGILFDEILDGTTGLTLDELSRLKEGIARHALLRADVDSATLLHHHQEVRETGRVAAEALVIADPMMLSPHKVAAVYDTDVLSRIDSYVKSFDDNMRLLPKGATQAGLRWQRAVYLSMLAAAAKLTRRPHVSTFRKGHETTSVTGDINSLRALVLKESTWGRFARAAGKKDENPDVKRALEALESAYVDVVNQFRRAVYETGGGESLNKFYPAR